MASNNGEADGKKPTDQIKFSVDENQMVRIELPKSMKRLRLTPEQAHQFAFAIIGAAMSALHQHGIIEGVKSIQEQSKIIVPDKFGQLPGPPGRMP